MPKKHKKPVYIVPNIIRRHNIDVGDIAAITLWYRRSCDAPDAESNFLIDMELKNGRMRGIKLRSDMTVKYFMAYTLPLRRAVAKAWGIELEDIRVDLRHYYCSEEKL